MAKQDNKKKRVRKSAVKKLKAHNQIIEGTQKECDVKMSKFREQYIVKVDGLYNSANRVKYNLRLTPKKK